jgi:hypothetical protein
MSDAFSELTSRQLQGKTKKPLKAGRKLCTGFLVGTVVGMSLLEAQGSDLERNSIPSQRSSLAKSGMRPSLLKQSKKASVGGPWTGISISIPLKAERVDSYSPFGSRLSARIGDAGARWGPTFASVALRTSVPTPTRLQGMPSDKAILFSKGRSSTRWLPSFSGLSSSAPAYDNSKSKAFEK